VSTVAPSPDPDRSRAPISAADVRKVARLSRLAVPDAQVEAYREQLGAVLGYVERLRELDLKEVEPLTHVGANFNRLAPDEPGPTLTNERLMHLVPEAGRATPPFIGVPKVLDEGGGA
jgi:aspartyl-tRNA(Asn)/glutamyl-tRNA(Gln) amidotransferase subunit C